MKQPVCNRQKSKRAHGFLQPARPMELSFFNFSSKAPGIASKGKCGIFSALTLLLRNILPFIGYYIHSGLSIEIHIFFDAQTKISPAAREAGVSVLTMDFEGSFGSLTQKRKKMKLFAFLFVSNNGQETKSQAPMRNRSLASRLYSFRKIPALS